jgi:hypothetical protein
MLNVAKGLSLPLEAVTQTFAVLAKRGVGKTYTGAVLAEEMLKAGQQVVVADPVGVWYGLRSSSDGKREGFPVVVFGGEHGDVPLEETAGEVIASAIIEHGFSAIIDLSILRKGAQVRFMTDFAETLYRLNRKPLHLFVDEADAFAPQRPMPGEQRLLGAFEDIVRRGRARGLGVTLITQRAAVLNKNVLTQIEVLVVLRTIAPQDRAAIDSWIEVHGTEKQREAMADKIASLAIGEAYFWSPGWLDIFQLVRVRTRETFDSSATPEVGKVAAIPKAMAEVDISALGEKIRTTVEKAKANDPAELKRTISELKRKLTAAEQKKPEVKQSEPVEVPVLTDEAQSLLRKVSDACDSVIQETKKRAADFDDLKSAIRNLSAAIGFRVSLGKERNIRPSIVAAPEPHRRQITPAQYPRNGETSEGWHASGGLRRMLIALAQRPGISKRQLGVRAGLSSTSGTFGTYLARGRSEGWIEGDGDNLIITDAGLLALGKFNPLPEGEDLLNYWLNELGQSGAGRMLTVLAESYPKALTKEEIGQLAEISPNSGTFGTYLSKLRTLELVEGRGEIKASREFFE